MEQWNKKMAECLSSIASRNGELEPVAIELALEAAGELKSCQLKILLAECHQILYEAATNEAQPTFDGDFLDRVWKAAHI